MFVFFIRKNSNIHIVELTSVNGRCYSICGLSTSKSERLYTLSADNTFPAICSKCKFICDEMYYFNLNNSIRSVRSSISRKIANGYIKNLKEFRIKKEYIAYFFRKSNPITKYKRLSRRTKKHV